MNRFLCALGIAGIFVGSLTVTFPASAATTYAGQNGKLAFTKTIEGRPSIWVMNPDGTNQKKLAGNGAHNPVWSPNGRKIAFVAGERIWVMNSDGSHQKILTWGVASRDGSPIWSPDGSRITFVRTKKASGRSAIISVGLHGLRETNISGWASQGGYRAPSWAPDGTRLVYEQYGSELGSRLLTKNIKSEQVTELTAIAESESSNVSWSPNGKKILYNDSYGQVYTIWPDGSHRAVISDGESYGASWSPDGVRKAFLEDFDGEYVSLSEEDGTVVWIPIDKSGYKKVGFPTWSPDGTKLIFAANTTREGRQQSDVFLLSLDDEAYPVTLLAQGEGISDISWQAK
jgi:Tol biopolymer transport system component